MGRKAASAAFLFALEAGIALTCNELNVILPRLTVSVRACY
jgi:hypothetical protein